MEYVQPAWNVGVWWVVDPPQKGKIHAEVVVPDFFIINGNRNADQFTGKGGEVVNLPLNWCFLGVIR